MKQEDYDLVPHKEILELKKDIEDIKHHPIESSPEGQNLIRVMTRLSESMEDFVKLFKNVSENMRSEGTPDVESEKRFGDVDKKLEILMDENKKLATGMVAIADMVKEMKSAPKPEIKAPPISAPRPAGPIGPPSFGSPMGGPPPMGAPTGGPPPLTPPMGPPSPLGPPPMGGPPPMPPPGAPMGGPGMKPLSAPPKKKGLFGLGR